MKVITSSEVESEMPFSRGLIGDRDRMGISFGKEAPKEDPEETKQRRATRDNQRNSLNRIPEQVNQAVDNKWLTPETAKVILPKVKEAQNWFKTHPTASLDEMNAQWEAQFTEINRIYLTDVPRRKIRNTQTSLPTIAQLLEQQKVLTREQKAKLETLATTLEKWQSKNAMTASDIDFKEEMITLNDSLVEIVPETEKREPIVRDLTFIQNLSSQELSDVLARAATQAKKTQSTQVDTKEGVEVMWDTAQKVFWGLLIVVLCGIGGSFAANLAIGRLPVYRVLYFIWGCIPIFAPFVWLQTIGRSIQKGPISMQAVLPISIEPATTRFGKFLWQPFYWIPDKAALDAQDEFQNNLGKMVA